jgi:hypothetical protein
MLSVEFRNQLDEMDGCTRTGGYLGIPRQQVEIVFDVLAVADKGKEECGLVRGGPLKGSLYRGVHLLYSRVDKQAVLPGQR